MEAGLHLDADTNGEIDRDRARLGEIDRDRAHAAVTRVEERLAAAAEPPPFGLASGYEAQWAGSTADDDVEVLLLCGHPVVVVSASRLRFLFIYFYFLFILLGGDG